MILTSAAAGANDIEQQIEQGLQLGADVSELTAQLPQAAPAPAPSAGAGAQLGQALSRYRTALLRVRASAAAGEQVVALNDAYLMLEAADLLMRARFDAVERQLQTIGADAARLRQTLAAYEQRIDALLEPLAGPLAEWQAHQAQPAQNPDSTDPGADRLLVAADAAIAQLDALPEPAAAPILRTELPYRNGSFSAALPSLTADRAAGLCRRFCGDRRRPGGQFNTRRWTKRFCYRPRRSVTTRCVFTSSSVTRWPTNGTTAQ